MGGTRIVRDGERQDFITGLRGFAVGIVIVFHATVWSRTGGASAPWLFFGHSGVDLFFVISGFCMMWPVLADGRVGRVSPGRFYLRRALRIAPPYLVALVLALLVSVVMWRTGGPSWWGAEPMQSTFPASGGELAGNLASHLTFTHGFFTDYDRSIDGAFWSLSTEWQFYAILPALLWIVRRFRLRVAITVTVVVPVIYTLAMHHFDPTFHDEAVQSDNIAYRLVEFGAGMLAAWLVSSRWTLPFLAPATVVLGLFAAYAEHYGPAVATPFTYAAAYGALTLLCWQSPAVRRVAEWRPLRRLGGISYSAYLVHGTVFMAVAVVGTNLDLGIAARSALELLVGIPLALAAAVLLHRLVEEPAAGWSQHVRGVNLRPARAAQPGPRMIVDLR